MEIILKIVYAVLPLGVIAFVFGILLAFAGKKFAVSQDERIEKIIEFLPGANCGACGYAGCSDCAENIVSGKASFNSCPGNSENNMIEISKIMGMDFTSFVKKVACVRCMGSKTNARIGYIYNGLNDCVTAMRINGGPKECSFACTGLGTCVKSCKFDAIHIVDGVAVVDKEKCTGCGMCAKSCPKNIIDIVPYDKNIVVRCSSCDSGASVRKMCDVGCIGCGLCVKRCPNNAITLENNLARIDHTKCEGCKECIAHCVRKIIVGE